MVRRNLLIINDTYQMQLYTICKKNSKRINKMQIEMDLLC